MPRRTPLLLCVLLLSPAAWGVVPGFNFCGLGQAAGYGAQPTNPLDRVCKAHDHCYRPAMAIQRRLTTLEGERHLQAWRRLLAIKCACDQAFVRDTEALVRKPGLPPLLKRRARQFRTAILLKGSCRRARHLTHWTGDHPP